MPRPFHLPLLPAALDRGLRAAGVGLAGAVLAAAWLTAGPGNWARPVDSVAAPAVRHVVLPRVEIVARRGAAGPSAEAGADARDDQVLRCAANTVGGSAIPAQN